MLKIKQTTAFKIILNIITTKTLPKDIDIILSGVSFYKSPTYQSALNNTNGGLIIYGITKEYGLRTIKDIDKFINKIREDQQSLNHNIETPFQIIKYKEYNIIIQEIPKAPLELQPIRKEYDPDTTSYYIKNNELTQIPSYIINSIRTINHTQQTVSECYDYTTKYDDVDLKKEFIDKYRNEYKTIYSLRDSEIIKALFPQYSHSLHYILLFSYLPQHYFPYLYINISDRRCDIKDYKITGSLFHMLKMSLLQLKKLMKQTLLLDSKGNVITKTTYIFEIIYELLYNALIHRDYTLNYQGEPINIYLYNNRITITNPGYYISDNPNYLYSKFKYSRNQSIKIVMDLLSASKKHGFKHIRRISKVYNTKEPVLYNNDGTFVSTIFSMQQESIYKEPYTIDAIATYCMEPKTKLEIYNHFFDAAKKDYGYFYAKFIEPLLDNGMLEFTIPEKPKSKFQKIKTSEKAIEMLFEH